MDWFNFKQLPIEFMVIAVAVFGGIARNLNGYINGQGFKLSIFISSVIVSAFGGLMFGWMGITLNVSTPMLFMMAGMGGFFSEQTLKFMYEIIKKKVK